MLRDIRSIFKIKIDRNVVGTKGGRCVRTLSFNFSYDNTPIFWTTYIHPKSMSKIDKLRDINKWVTNNNTNEDKELLRLIESKYSNGQHIRTNFLGYIINELHNFILNRSYHAFKSK